MDSDLSLLPQAAAQMRGALSNLYFAAARLAPSSAREQDPELDAKAALVDQSYYRLIRLVNDLAATQYLNGEPLPLRDRDVVEFVTDIFAKAASLAPFRDLETRLICAADRHLCAFCPDALEQLLYQLLSNAFKFTPSGGLITVELRLAAGRVFLSVEDTGPGIPEEELAKLFQRFYRGRAASGEEGVGVGLYLVRQIAQGQGGYVKAFSRPGRGAKFSLFLPRN